ncbi:hypothetical protein SprV_0301214700 [Sparganum proliferum]
MNRDYLTLIMLVGASLGLLKNAEGSKITAPDWSVGVGTTNKIQFLSRYLDVCSDSISFDGKTRKRSPEPLWVVE